MECVLAQKMLRGQLLGEEFLKAAGGFVQCGVFGQLDNADLEHLFIGVDGGGLIAAVTMQGTLREDVVQDGIEGGKRYVSTT